MKKIVAAVDNVISRWCASLESSLVIHFIVTVGFNILIALCLLASTSHGFVMTALLFMSTFFVMNLIEWLIHRHILHSRVLVPWIGDSLFKQHALHHSDFMPKGKLVNMPGWYNTLISPKSMLLVWSLICMIGMLSYLAAGFSSSLVVVASCLIYVVIYDVFHITSHSPFAEWRILKPVFRHHHEHHKEKFNAGTNWNVTFPIWDIIFRTKS